MKKITLLTVLAALLGSGPLFAEVDIVSLHSSVGHMVQTTLMGVDPLMLVAGLLLFLGTIAYRFRRAR